MPDQERDWPDQLQGMWDQLETVFRDESDEADFIDRAQDLFFQGFIESGHSTEARQEMRDEFFALMDEFDISIESFDWDDWRDWYEGS